MSDRVRVRFAPSPTGDLHVGGARTALYNWLFARHHDGVLILRIEDTDVERSTAESAEAIVESLQWLGLDWDEGPYRQAERLAIYREHAERLLEVGKAYRCVCTPGELEERRKVALAAGRSPRYDGRCRDRRLEPEKPWALRLRVQDTGVTIVNDIIHGEVRFDNAELDDFILVRSDGLPTYNFAVVVDDALMEVTHVIRGDDHLSNTPKQIQVYRVLDFPLPQFAHVPMILGPDRTRLSKRHGATSVLAYRDLGYLPEALVNYLVRLGWSHGDQEIFSRDELVRYFELTRVGHTPAVFDHAKLDWLNAHYLREAHPKRIADQLVAFWLKAGVSAEEIGAATVHWSSLGRARTFAEAVVETFGERSKTLCELAQTSRFLFRRPIEYDVRAREKYLQPETERHLQEVCRRIRNVSSFDAATLEKLYRDFVAERRLKLGDVAQPTRVALTGHSVSPPLFQVMELLGRDICVERLEAVLQQKND
ncbi:MAG: glutamate--tRNA ligase [Candidatus Methylomirabilales bacterium]|nr:glutamate--tRNA ligase [candidate division NC10 bacterium]